jgi:hypothetical protein
MKARDYYELFRYLAEKCLLTQDSIILVENIAEWCRERDISEPDPETPLRMIAPEGRPAFMLIKEDIPMEIIDERIEAFRIRSQLKSVAFDRADMLNSAEKKLAYLFLSEYAIHLPEMMEDPRLADDWAYDMMDRLGYFQDVRKE